MPFRKLPIICLGKVLSKMPKDFIVHPKMLSWLGPTEQVTPPYYQNFAILSTSDLLSLSADLGMKLYRSVVPFARRPNIRRGRL